MQLAKKLQVLPIFFIFWYYKISTEMFLLIQTLLQKIFNYEMQLTKKLQVLPNV